MILIEQEPPKRMKLAPLSSQIIPQLGILLGRDYQPTSIMVASYHPQYGFASHMTDLKRGLRAHFPRISLPLYSIEND